MQAKKLLQEILDKVTEEDILSLMVNQDNIDRYNRIHGTNLNSLSLEIVHNFLCNGKI
jgi:hypothetical protein